MSGFDLPGRRFPLGGTVADWEFEGLLIGERESDAVADRGLVDASVESGAELIHHLAKLEAEPDRAVLIARPGLSLSRRPPRPR